MILRFLRPVSSLLVLTKTVLFANAQEDISCPRLGAAPISLTEGSHVRLEVTQEDQLCILARISARGHANTTTLVPAGRSYDGHGWESVAGEFRDLKFACDKPKSCFVHIPKLDDPVNEAFQLFRLDRSTLSHPQQVSRFLEQATFGPTKELIDGWDYTSFRSSFASWIKNQMNGVPHTEHRVTFRSKTIPEYTTKHNIGRPKNPCELHSRWRKHAITEQDEEKTIEIKSVDQRNNNLGPYYLIVDNEVRTVVEHVVAQNSGELPPGKYSPCHWLFNGVGGRFHLNVNGNCDEIEGGNPPVQFPDSVALPPNVIDFPPGTTLTVVNGGLTNGSEVVLDTDELSHPVCHSTPFGGALNSIHGRDADGLWYTFDPRAVLSNNTLEDPLSDGGGKIADLAGTACSSAPRTFLNEDSCRLSTSASACGSHEIDDVSLKLNSQTLLELYNLTSRYVLSIGNLEVSTSPCIPGDTVRWRVTEDKICESSIESSDIRNALMSLIITAEVVDNNGFIKDVVVPKDSRLICNEDAIGAKIMVDGTCYEHVHKDYHNVYDFTEWESPSEDELHSENATNALLEDMNSIKKVAESNQHIWEFPRGTENWETSKGSVGPAIARYGDSVTFPNLPDHLRKESVMEKFGALGPSPNGSGVVVCGSPGEVANMHLIDGIEFGALLNEETDETRKNNLQKKTIWFLNALYGKDQLRQRVAHALSQTMVISTVMFSAIKQQTEVFVSFYDILVRNAFGNYRDVLREVSYNPMMGEMLTYINSEGESSEHFPDENYAREIIQLFTIGTIQLNDDGTPVTNEYGQTIQAYTNEDIMEGARAWTGFRWQGNRGNIEKRSWNRLDPMQIVREWRDRFPKMLLGGYIGDGYPLCADLPDKSFLRVGAKYRLLGSHSAPELQYDDPDWAFSESTKRVVLDAEHSALHNILCNSDGKECNFRPSVVLTENIGCHGIECDIDTVRIVQVAKNIFYEYVRVPCVEMSFFNNGRKIKAKRDGRDIMCADPRLIAATESCCLPGTSLGTRACEYFGERMTYKKAMERCDKRSFSQCDYKLLRRKECGECCNGHNGHRWTNSPCTVKAKVNEKGMVAIVHDAIDRDGSPVDHANIQDFVNRDTFHWFRVEWTSEGPPLGEACEENGGEMISDGSCLYDAIEVETPVFHGRQELIETRELLERCRVGALHPTMFDNGTYTVVEALSTASGPVVVWAKNGTAPYDTGTVFEVSEHGVPKFVRNVLLTVELSTQGADKISFRNTPQFINLLERDLRDVQYETEAVIDRYFYHKNTAQFLASRMIQRFGFSNPSPRFVRTVATAFRKGYYLWEEDSGTQKEVAFGSFKYGDLGAMIAAILLDREARSPILDADPSFGSIREPLIKVTHFMRALGIKTGPDFMLDDVEDKIGQMQYSSETIFSWFEPDFSPPGPISEASLLSPEATIMNTPNVLGLLSGLLSLVKYGVSYCDNGLGRRSQFHCSTIKEGQFDKARGTLSYKPDADNVDGLVEDLSLLLTAGRLSPRNHEVVKQAYEARLEASSTEVSEEKEAAALRVALQVLAATPEFHTTNIVEYSGESRAPPREKGEAKRPYKALVYFFMSGGCDSYNVLVPYDCPLYEEYEKKRSEHALAKRDLKPINATGSGQPCDSFGVNEDLSFVQELYNNQTALFFANTGMLFEPVTTADYQDKTKTQLFAHDVQRRVVKETDPQKEVIGTGVLGRAANALSNNGYKASTVSVEGNMRALHGEDGRLPVAKAVGTGGIHAFDPTPSSDKILPSIKRVNNATALSSGFFSETWSRSVNRALHESEMWEEELKDIPYPEGFPGTKLGKQLQNIARLIDARQNRAVERDIFYASTGNWDAHHELKVNMKESLAEVNGALKAFHAYMEKQGLWDNVVFITSSEFGRTITPNSSGGTDHAWGGNYFMAGGAVKGGRILGQYPDNFDDLDIGRGRLIPTTSHEQCLNGLMEWLGVSPSDMDHVLPNRIKFSNDLYSSKDLFVQE